MPIAGLENRCYATIAAGSCTRTENLGDMPPSRTLSPSYVSIPCDAELVPSVAATSTASYGYRSNAELSPSMPTKEHIIYEIRRVADKIGRPPGRRVFENETGIRMPEWYGVYFRNWGDALKEAGYKPNQKQNRLSSEQVLRKYAEAVRNFGRVPTEIDIRMYSRDRQDFPGHTTFTSHFGNKAGLIVSIRRRPRLRQRVLAVGGAWADV